MDDFLKTVPAGGAEIDAIDGHRGRTIDELPSKADVAKAVAGASSLKSDRRRSRGVLERD